MTLTADTSLHHLQDMRRSILAQLPTETRFTAEHARVIQRHQALLRGWTDDLVRGFYDTLYTHEPTRAIFEPGERPAREQTLVDWWQRVIDGPIDDQFWDWMTFVGLVHVVRKVKNPMMIAAWGYLEEEILLRASRALPAQESAELGRVFARFGKTFNALVAESYVIHYLEAVAESTGSVPALLDRLVMSEIGELLNRVKPSFR